MIYFDNSATSNPKPGRTIENMINVLEHFSVNPGRGGHRFSIGGSKILFEARETINKFVNGESLNNIVFTSGGTEGLNTALLGMLDCGDHLITTNAEHNSVYRPLSHLNKLGVDHEIAICEDDGYTSSKNIQQLIKKNTKVVVLNHISNLTGIIQPLDEISKVCKDNGLLLIVDGSQSFGYYEYDLKREAIDVLVATGHKGLLGPQGTGFMYIRDSTKVRPLKYGGTGSESESISQPEILPDKYESGTQNLPGISGLVGGISFIEEETIEKMVCHKNKIREHFVEEIRKISGIKIYGDLTNHSYAPVVALNIKEIGSSEISFMLDYDYDIMTRAGLHCAPLLHERMGTTNQGAVRFSFGYHNTHAEIEFGVEALKKITKSI